MFNLAIDSKLRDCDVVALRVEDIAANGNTNDRATIRQRKTGQYVKFELIEQTRQTVDEYLTAAGKNPGDFLFAGRRNSKRSITTRQYARLVSEWVDSYDAVAVGDVPRILSVLHPDLAWTEAEGFPYFSGTWRHPQDVVEKLLVPLARDWEGFAANPQEF